MTAKTERIKRKLSLVQLAEDLGNASNACQIMGNRNFPRQGDSSKVEVLAA